MKSIFTQALIAAVLSGLCVTSAKAAQLEATYTGVVTSGADTGETFIATFLYDTSVAPVTTNPPLNSFFSDAGGGETATLALSGGTSFTYSAETSFSADNFNNGTTSGTEHDIAGLNGFLSLSTQSAGTGIPFDLEVPFSPVASSTSFGQYGNMIELGELQVATVEVSLVSAVPLPASAPMLGAALLVLGAVGYRANRRKEAGEA